MESAFSAVAPLAESIQCEMCVLRLTQSGLSSQKSYSIKPSFTLSSERQQEMVAKYYYSTNGYCE